MEDQSFNTLTLSQILRKSDFRAESSLSQPATKLATLTSAVDAALNLFAGQNPLTRSQLKSKDIFQIRNFANRLVVRKLYLNIQRVAELRQQNRDFVVANLAQIVSEGIPYRVYRLDVKDFYESFNSQRVVEELEAVPKLSPLTKKLVSGLFQVYVASGGVGIPRGLALSAILSELMMQEFDAALRICEGVYFFARYVDDIIVVTNGIENERAFLRWIRQKLPPGLFLNDQKTHVRTAKLIAPISGNPHKILEFDYLGYCFSVFNPTKVPGAKGSQFRPVTIDIASSKVAKIKTRITRSFLSFIKNSDFDLLALRIKYLTSNIRVMDFDKNVQKFAGIYYNYRQVTPDATSSLAELDRFLRYAILSKNSRPFSTATKLLNEKQKDQLLSCSFFRGHRRRTVIYIHPTEIRKVLECWAHG